MNFAVEDYRRGDFGGWGVIPEETGVSIGTFGLDAGYSSELAFDEVGYVLSREYWGWLRLNSFGR